MPPELTRYRMSLDLSHFESTAPVPANYRVEAIKSEDVDTLAVLLVESYRGTTDWDLMPELQTAEGCRRYLAELFSGRPIFEGRQGEFRPDLSFKIICGDQLCGTMYSLFTGSTVYVIDFSVAPKCRQRGVGTVFLSYALTRYRKGGYSRAVLLVTESNVGAVRLYKKLGFEVEEVLQE